MSKQKIPAGIVGKRQERTASIERDQLAARAEGDDRIPVSLSSEEPVDRWFGREILVHEKKAINLDRAGDGLPFLDGHDPDRQIGLVEDVALGEDGKLRGLLRQGNHPDAGWIFRDIEAGIRRNISIGYRVNELKLDESSDDGPDTYRATKWTLLEGSTVSIPADQTVGVGRSEDDTKVRPEPMVIPIRFEIEKDSKSDGARAVEVPVAPAVDAVVPKAPIETRATTHKEKQMSEEIAPVHKPGPAAVSLEEQRKEIASITRLAAEHGMSEHLPGWFERGLTRDQIAAEILERKRDNPAKPVDVPGYLGMSEREGMKYNFNRAAMSIATQQWDKSGGYEKEVSDQVAKRLNKSTAGIFIPLDLPVMTRASVTGNVATTSSLGGAGVQTSVLSLIDLLRNKMLVRQLGATVLSGLTGNITFPRHIVANTMAWEGENPSTAHAHTAATFDNVALSPKTAMASSAYSRQLLIQQSFDASAFIQNDLATVLALGLDLAAIDGTGSNNQPTGIMRQTGVTVITHGGSNGGIPTWAELVSYETNIATNNADFGSFAWVTTPGVKGKLKTVLKSTTAGSTYLWESDQSINGYPAFATNQVPSGLTFGTATTLAHGIVFGNWAELLIGEWGGALEVIVDPYTLASQGMVAITQMLMADIAVRHPKSFSTTKSALIA